MEEAIIRLQNIHKVYQLGKVNVPALRGINLEIFPGSFVTIMGASGSGKSTLLNMIGCLDSPSQGKIFLDNEDTALFSESKLAEIRGKKIGFIFQQFNLLQNLFVVYGCFFFDIGQNTVNYNKNKKIYMYDPFFVRIFSDRLNITVETEKIVEGIVGAKIKQKNVLDDVYFTKIKKETDFVLSSKTAREVKYQNSVSKEDFVNKHYFKDFKLLSKDVFDENIIPVYVYLFTVKI